jgi:hypothetical protein
MSSYAGLIKARRALQAPPRFATLAQVKFEGEWITPYQIRSRSPNGPALVAHHWLDAPSVDRYRHELTDGFLPRMAFNKVLERALELCGLRREDIYVTQALHLLPPKRCRTIPKKLVDESFARVTRYELAGRRVIALGGAAAEACARHGITAAESPHPSARGHSYEERARALAAFLR